MSGSLGAWVVVLVLALGAALVLAIRARRRREAGDRRRRAVDWWRSHPGRTRWPVVTEVSPDAMYWSLWSHAGGIAAAQASSRNSDVFDVLRVLRHPSVLPPPFDVRGGLGFDGRHPDSGYQPTGKRPTNPPAAR